MAGSTRLPPTPRPRRRRAIVFWVAIACLLAVVIEVGAVTNVFGLGSLFGSKGGSSSPGAGPNPYDENITSVTGAIVFSQKVDPFPQLNGASLCSQCPVAPTIDSSTDPAIAVLWVYFYVTYSGENYTTISNFTLTTSGGQNPTLFVLLGVFTGPYFSEPATLLGFSPGTTYEVGLHIDATSIPYDGPSGYQLTFHVTSP